MAKVTPDQFAAKVKEFYLNAEKIVNKGRESAAKEIAQALPALILKDIAIGKSPVAGEGRFKDYSNSYKESIRGELGKRYSKKLRPVNLTLSGDMLKSITGKSVLYIAFIKFSNKLAYIHTVLGAGRNKTIRKLLAQGGEAFSANIKRALVDIIKRNLPY